MNLKSFQFDNIIEGFGDIYNESTYSYTLIGEIMDVAKKQDFKTNET